MNRSFVLRCVPVTVALLVVIAQDVAAQPRTIRVSTREQLVSGLAAARPGTTILIAPGTYRGGIHQVGLRGTKEQPIVIAAADPDPPVFDGGYSAMQLSSPQHVELRNLVIRRSEANGLNIDHGGDPDTPARHVTLKNLVVRDIPRGNRDGIKLSAVDDFHVEDCTVEHWGDGGSAIDMVGCSKGEITGCTFRHERADSANGVQAKGGSREIVIRRCRFENAGGRAVNLGGSTGLAHFRPGWKGSEARAITVEDCTFIGSMSPVAFVGVDGAVVRHNTFYRPTRWVLRILQETQEPDFVPCRNGTFANNVIAFRSDEVRTPANVGGGTAPETFTFRENAWYCIDRPAATRNLIQLPVRETNATYGVDPEFRAAEKGDLSLRASNARRAGVRPGTNGEDYRSPVPPK